MLDKETIKQLSQDMQTPTLSLYLHVDPGYRENQADTPAWLIFMKNALKTIEQRLTNGEGERWQKIRKQLEGELLGYRANGKTLVLFIDESRVWSQELPVTLEQAYQYGAPMLTPLLWAIDEFKQYLIVLVDKERARFLSAYLGSTSSHDEMKLDIDDYDWRQRTQMPASTGDRALRMGSNRERFEDMIAAHVDRFHKSVAERVTSLDAEMNTARIIIGGDKNAANALKDDLHPSLRERVADVVSIPLDTPAHDLSDVIQRVATHYERSYETDLVNEVINKGKAGGRGALGLEAVQRAFDMQQVETLILPYDYEDQQVAAELTLKALQLNSKIELIHGSAASVLREVTPIAARLYFAV